MGKTRQSNEWVSDRGASEWTIGTCEWVTDGRMNWQERVVSEWATKKAVR